MKNLLITLTLLLLTLSSAAQRNLVSYVDTRIGTGAHNNDFSHGRDQLGQCMPAVLVPNGMNFWTAQTESSEGHGVSPYYADKTKIQGFRNSHYINGGSTQDYGTVTIMPMLDELKCSAESRACAFSHDDETFRPDYYSVPLYDGNIFAEMTGTSRTGIFRFTFRKSGTAYIVITPNSDEGKGSVNINAEQGEVTGSNPVHRIYQGKGKSAGFKGYFIVQVKNKITSYGTFENGSPTDGQKTISDKKEIGAYISFPVKAGEKVIVKVASSFCDVDGARNNMTAENPGWNFDKVRKVLTKTWEKRLSAIKVESKSTEELTKFYTSLYHASFLPHAFNDVDGRYPSFAGGKTIEHIDGTYYADYSLWDTFRALHPLLSILYPKQTGDMMQSLILKYEQGGWLPIFPAWNSYTSEMIGDPCASLIADAYDKGIRNFDIDKAYEALIKNAFSTPAEYNDYKDGKGRRALKSYIQYGFIPLEDSVKEAYHKREQVSRTLEYAYDDFCVARFAEQLGKKDVSAKLYQRAQNYRSVFDPRIGYVQGRHSDGSFENKRPDKGQPFITEGNACQYSWYVPQDVYGLMECMGGREEYLLKLDSMFTQHRMWHGNEPSHHIGFMYNYAGEPWKTQKEVRNIMSTDYKLGANGLSGNDDSGQMSAWYIFASLGFYPVCPAGGYYVIGSPSFSKAEITMENGNKFIVIARDASPNNIYIQSAMLNGKPYTKNFILHSDIASGGLLEFVMGSKPNKQWGSMPTDCPPRLDR